MEEEDKEIIKKAKEETFKKMKGFDIDTDDKDLEEISKEIHERVNLILNEFGKKVIKLKKQKVIKMEEND